MENTQLILAILPWTKTQFFIQVPATLDSQVKSMVLYPIISYNISKCYAACHSHPIIIPLSSHCYSMIIHLWSHDYSIIFPLLSHYFSIIIPLSFHDYSDHVAALGTRHQASIPPVAQLLTAIGSASGRLTEKHHRERRAATVSWMDSNWSSNHYRLVI